MGWVPTLKGTVMDVLALPSTRGELTGERLPIVNVTDPVGVPAPGGTAVTVAVTVTFCPRLDGSGDETTVVADSARFTVCGSLPLELAKLLLPL